MPELFAEQSPRLALLGSRCCLLRSVKPRFYSRFHLLPVHLRIRVSQFRFGFLWDGFPSVAN